MAWCPRCRCGSGVPSVKKMMMYLDRARSAGVAASMSVVSVSYAAPSAPWSSVRLSAWLIAVSIAPRSGVAVKPLVT